MSARFVAQQDPAQVGFGSASMTSVFTVPQQGPEHSLLGGDFTALVFLASPQGSGTIGGSAVLPASLLAGLQHDPGHTAGGEGVLALLSFSSQQDFAQLGRGGFFAESVTALEQQDLEQLSPWRLSVESRPRPFRGCIRFLAVRLLASEPVEQHESIEARLRDRVDEFLEQRFFSSEGLCRDSQQDSSPRAKRARHIHPMASRVEP